MKTQTICTQSNYKNILWFFFLFVSSKIAKTDYHNLMVFVGEIHSVMIDI